MPIDGIDPGPCRTPSAMLGGDRKRVTPDHITSRRKNPTVAVEVANPRAARYIDRRAAPAKDSAFEWVAGC